MRKLFVFILAFAAPLIGSAQGIFNNGAFIVCSGAAQIYIAGGTNGDYWSQSNGRITPSATGVITLEGDWINVAGNTGFTADAGNVVMNGAAQRIDGTSSTTFYNLTLQGTGTKTLFVNTTVGGVATTTGILSLGTRPLDLNTRTLTLSNPAAGAVTYTTGYAISETNAAGNPSIITWNYGTSTGARIYPFGTTGGVLIPLTFNKTSAVAANVSIATRPTAASDNLPWSTTVTHMYDPTLAQDGSDEAVIDRWWDFTSTGTITADVTFSYRGAENTMIAPYNTGNIGAQWWAAAWLPNNANIGSAPAVLAGVGTVSAPGLTFNAATFTPMVLSALAAPLPVELVSFTSQCNGSSIDLNWTTASEINNNFFTVQRSDDGISFYDIGVVQGNGTSSMMHSYTLSDNIPTSGAVYYRLRQTDYNGQYTTTPLIVQEQCGNAVEVISSFGTGSDVVVSVFTPLASEYTINILDAQGKLIAVNQVSAGEGSNRFEMNGILPAVGMYMITVTGASGIQHNNKVYVQK
jgi:hypothetical protein